MCSGAVRIRCAWNRLAKRRRPAARKRPKQADATGGAGRKAAPIAIAGRWSCRRICSLFKTLLRQVRALVCQRLSVRYFVFDGAFGHNQALQMVRRTGLELISKLRHNAALYRPYDGPYAGRGPRRKYGHKLDYHHLPPSCLKATSVAGQIHTAIYQLSVWHKTFPDLLNVVILVKTNQRTGAQAHVILFSSDLELGYETLIEYYRLRFQIEFNFRDAKQYWGLEDFMVIKAAPVYNSANLADADGHPLTDPDATAARALSGL